MDYNEKIDEKYGVKVSEGRVEVTRNGEEWLVNPEGAKAWISVADRLEKAREQNAVYGVYDMGADSFSGTPRLIDVYATEAAALAAISESLKNSTYKREPFGDFIHNYTYEGIKLIPLKS